MSVKDSSKIPDGYTRTEKVCKVCGDKFYVRDCLLNKRPWDFCSRKCYYTRPFDAENFWRRVDKSGGPDVCWPWTGVVCRIGGYGDVSYHGRMYCSHQVAWIITNGPVPKGLILRHTCNNPLCCNCKHLQPGTHAQNKADSVAAGTYVHGTKNPRAKFTDAIILEIRSKWASGKITQTELAQIYRSDTGSICRIVHGKAWKHVIQNAG